ncbi:hypothetical protein ACN42_g2895 [Penicillium freii]|uniref:Uncharacterized protein n=1 Tax=Penicillium freii TaxID=48697 RepID=A0A101MP96_PENFR|nr:hypothetical protein ACN42_g2895 [Penicillium freii]
MSSKVEHKFNLLLFYVYPLLSYCPPTMYYVQYGSQDVGIGLRFIVPPGPTWVASYLLLANFKRGHEDHIEIERLSLF